MFLASPTHLVTFFMDSPGSYERNFHHEDIEFCLGGRFWLRPVPRGSYADRLPPVVTGRFDGTRLRLEWEKLDTWKWCGERHVPNARCCCVKVLHGAGDE